MHYVKTYAALWLYPTIDMDNGHVNCKEKDLGAKLVSQDILKWKAKCLARFAPVLTHPFEIGDCGSIFLFHRQYRTPV
jgi:hypothetical protein